MQQILFRLRIPGIQNNGIPLYGYGLMLLVAFLACIIVAVLLAKRKGVSTDVVQDLAIWMFLGGLIGARTAFLVLEAKVPDLWTFLKQFPRLWDGGVIFYGAAFGGLIAFVLAYFFLLRKHQVSAWKMVDIVAPAVALGLSFGRIGCLLNGCCYGDVSCPHCIGIQFPVAAPARFDMVHHGYQTAAGFTLEPFVPGLTDGLTVATVQPGSPAEREGLKPGDEIQEINGDPVKDAGELSQYFANPDNWRGRGWTMELTVQKANGGQGTLAFAPKTLPIYPTQVYESISMFLLFLLLLAFFPFKKHDGQVIALLMIGYGIHRYFNEMLRADVRPTGFESWTSVILVLAGAALMLWLWRKPVERKPKVVMVRA